MKFTLRLQMYVEFALDGTKEHFGFG